MHVRRSPAYAVMLVGALCAAAAPAARADVLVRFKTGASAAERADVRREAGVRRERGFAVAGLEAVTTGAAREEAAAAALRREPGVLYAEPDHARRATLLPSDPLFTLQWGLTRISAPTAWNTTTGSPQIVVGVADTGVALSDPDLAPNLVAGWDFVGDDAVPEDETPAGHGSHVAAIIGARGNDATGLAGVTWSAGIMPLRVLDADGQGRVTDTIAAYERAANAGVRVVNLSFEGPNASSAERDALAAAADVLFVVAAGNLGADVDRDPSYPCAYDLPNVLCVTASDRADGRPAFANVGARGVDLAAPGVAIGGPVPGGGWTAMTGTSMAAPHVAGAAALLLSREPAARPADLIAALTGTTEPAPAFAGLTVSGGRLDVASALDAVRVTPSPAPTPSATVTPPAAAPPAASDPPRSAPVLSPAPAPAKLKLRRARIHSGRLDVLALITRAASGSVDVSFRARGRLIRFAAPIEGGRIRLARRLPRSLRTADGGIVTLRWRGSATVRATSVRLRAASRPAGLRRDSAVLRNGRLVVRGRISARARGVVRLRLAYVDGSKIAERSLTAKIHAGRWRAAAPVATAARAGGYLTLQFTGYRSARGGALRGEQDGIALAGS